MPIYVYECQSCEKVFEVEQRIIEDPLTDCDCGKKGSLKRLIQPTAVMFKGSGFYVNDVSSGKNPASEKVEPKSDTETPAKAEKPEPASVSKTDSTD